MDMSNALLGIIFECPECETKLSGTRKGVKKSFPNTCPTCDLNVIVTESIHDDYLEIRIIAKKEVRDFIKKKWELLEG